MEEPSNFRFLSLAQGPLTFDICVAAVSVLWYFSDSFFPEVSFPSDLFCRVKRLTAGHGCGTRMWNSHYWAELEKLHKSKDADVLATTSRSRCCQPKGLWG